MNIATHSGVGPFSIKLLATGLGLLLSACGGGSTPDSNTAPTLTGVMDFAVDENTTEVATFQASDADGDVISYSINGQDAGAFSIGGQSGVLVFRDSPDFENPADEDQDNLYQLSVVASDGQLSASLGIVVTVNDVLEGEGGFHGIASVAAVDEVAQAGHLVQGVRHGDFLGEDGAGFGRLDDDLWVDYGEVPIGGGQGVDAPVGQAKAQSTEEGGCDVVGVAGAGGDLFAVEGHGQQLVGPEVRAGQGCDTEGGGSG